MPKKTEGALKTERRDYFMQKIKDFLTEQGEDVAFISGNTINLPTVDEYENERWIEIKVSVPAGARGEEYDGYSLREDYDLKIREQADKKERLAKEKAPELLLDGELQADAALVPSAAEQKVKREALAKKREEERAEKDRIRAELDAKEANKDEE